MNYNQLNAHPRDAALAFDPVAHEYTLAGRVLRSVTSVVDDCFEKFDAPYWAARKATPQRPAHVLLAEWEENARRARDLGTLMHDRIERFYLGCPPDADSLTDPTFTRFLDFAASRRLSPFRTEWRIYIEECGLAGSLDFLGRDSRGDFEIWDWKRSSKLVDPAGNLLDRNPWRKFGLGPVSHLPDTAFHHYALQVSIYRFILKHKYGITTAHAHLGVFHPDLPAFRVVDLPYLESEVRAVLAALSTLSRP